MERKQVISVRISWHLYNFNKYLKPSIYNMLVAILYTHWCQNNYYKVYNVEHNDFYKLKNIRNDDADDNGIYWIERNYGEVDPDVDAIIGRLFFKSIHMVDYKRDEDFVQEVHSIYVVCLSVKLTPILFARKLKNLGCCGNWTHDLSHPKRESYH